MGNAKKNKWFIAYKEIGDDIFNTSGLKIVEPPEGTYQADPFIVSHAGKHYVFHEWYDYDRGRIAVSELTDDGMTHPDVVLDPGYHVSFPAVVKVGNDYFMTPETGANRRIEIYRAKKFPHEWELYSHFGEGHYSDVVMIPRKPYQIYTTVDGDKLRIFMSHDMKEWEQIYAEDETCSRPAGNFFQYKSFLIRPTQDCSEVYGGAITFKTSMPQSHIFKRIEPFWAPNLTGTHTFNFDDKYVVIDGRVKL